jgi:magnesium transporter
LHPLIIEDAITIQPPKLDIFDDHIFVILQSPNTTEEDIDYDKISFYVSKNFFITIRKTHTKIFDDFVAKVMHDAQIYQSGPDFLFYNFADMMVDQYNPYMDILKDKIDDIEEEIFAEPESTNLESIFALRRSLLSLRRVVNAQIAIFSTMYHTDFDYISDTIEIYFKDLYDHLSRIRDSVENYRDSLSGAMQISMTVSTAKSNEVMRILTIITTIMMPLTVIASFWGMNLTGGMQWFFNNPWIFYGNVVFMIGLSVTMLIWFKMKRWL